MKLDRNTNPQGIGKYALIKLRQLPQGFPVVLGTDNEQVTLPMKCVDFGDTADTEFFVIRLKDKYAAAALTAYANQANRDDPEYANEVHKLAQIAARYPNKRKPD